MDNVVESQLAEARNRLLDLTMRNRLLNFRPTRRTTVQIVDEIPAEIWKLLVEQRKAMSFLAREEHELFGKPGGGAEPRRAGARADDAAPAAEQTDSTDSPDAADASDGELFALPDLAAGPSGKDEALPERYTDRFLQTWLPGEELQTNLLRTYQAARSALEERGVNLLFLAMGFLEWREATHPDRALKAPILLVPVALERTSARTRFKLSALEDDPVLNPCLLAKLEREYGLALPAAPEDWTEFSLDSFLQGVAQAVSPQATWRVLPDMYVALLSFAKYLMYVDLDPGRWPAGKGLSQNSLVCGMCGDDSAPAGAPGAAPGAADLPDRLDPQEVFQVLDADASQQEAILAAKAGRSLVIEGPPGTGKSQTITNVIAECLAAGRTVLFVSEKMAALEVVKRRLDGVGLGDFCLELHSTKANRKSVVGELRTALEEAPAAGPRPADGAGPAGPAKELAAVRDRLNAYVRALHEPFGQSGISPYQAMGRIALLHDIPDVACGMPGHAEWTAAEIEDRKEQVRRLGRRMEAVWPAQEHPWRGVRATLADAELQAAAGGALSALRTALEGMRDQGAAAASMLGAKPPTTLRHVHRLLEAAALVASPPQVADRLLRENLWDQPPPEIQALLKKVQEATEIRQALQGRYKEDLADGVDWQGVHERFRRKYTSLPGRWLRPRYWSDRGLIKQARAEGYRPRSAEQLEDLHRLARLQSLKADLRAGEELGIRYLDAAWAGDATDWQRIEGLARWLMAFRKMAKLEVIGGVGIDLAAEGADREALLAASDRLRQHAEAWQANWARLTEAVQLKEPMAFEYPVIATDLSVLAERLAAMAERIETLVDWTQYQEALQACEAGPLAQFAQRALAQSVEPDVLALAMEKRLAHLLMKGVLAQREALGQFRGDDHEADRRSFAKLDAQWIARSGDRLRGKLTGQKPSGNLEAARSSQLGILQGEVRRVRGGRTIRSLLRDAADAIQKLKPCLMMSPLSVAQFVDPAGMRFDAVVFDEASQVEPADALGAIARGRQLLLVGDPKQLPPTSFFDSMGGEGTPGDADTAAGLSDMESILDRGAMVLPALRLRWHYRSRHESLITFSNSEFYGNSLVVFPSSHRGGDGLGLSMLYEPGDRYDRGRSGANRDQARRIAQWVFEHAAQHPDKTLGVGAFSQRQQQAVLDEIEKLRRQDGSAEEFFDTARLEPFFVKNLETIQGDERDVILLSIGYGKASPEERLSMNFGPLNQENGWRRLNVLVTRARERCVVFSGIRAEDFDLGATDARGVHALRGYLEYAASGRIPAAQAGGGLESAFEQAVRDALAAQGVALHRHVGLAGSTIDLAVVDPQQPDRYVLGIECDGSKYRDFATARDRDRLRQQVLEGLGWRIHRIWSPDWYRSPQKELARAMDAIQSARQGRLEASFVGLSARAFRPGRPPAAGAAPEAQPAEEQPAAPAIPTEPYRYYQAGQERSAEDFYVEPLDALARTLCQIVRSEGPIHEGELTRRLAGAWGMSRIGPRVQKRIAEALEVAASKGPIPEGTVGPKGPSLRRQGDFLWPADMDTPPVRRREDGSVKDIDLICPEEIAHAARLLLAAQFGMNRQDLVSQVARVFGFGKTGTRIGEKVEEVLRAEVEAGRITEDDGGLLKAAPKAQGE